MQSVVWFQEDSIIGWLWCSARTRLAPRPATCCFALLTCLLIAQRGMSYFTFKWKTRARAFLIYYWKKWQCKISPQSVYRVMHQSELKVSSMHNANLGFLINMISLWMRSLYSTEFYRNSFNAWWQTSCRWLLLKSTAPEERCCSFVLLRLLVKVCSLPFNYSF